MPLDSVQPPSPVHILRLHRQPVTAIFISEDNERIFTSDSSGRVIVTSARSMRAISDWQAHTNSILGIEEIENIIITLA